MNKKKILMITGDFTEDYETMVPFQTLLAVGVYSGTNHIKKAVNTHD